MKVCVFGAWDPAYPRNRVLRTGLRRAGVEVLEVRTPARRALRRYPALVTAFARTGRTADVVLVPEFRHKDVPLARWLARGRRLVFDPLVSRWDTLVNDWRLHREGSAQARWNRRLDRTSLSLPDIVLCDTWAHGALFAALGARRERLRRVLVGCEDGFFAVPEPPAVAPVRIVYVGGFLPLHGTRVIVEAVARLERDASKLPAFQVAMVGRGIECDAARDLAHRAALTRIEFPGATDYGDAPRVLADAHVVLGAFGAGDKAGRVIPHKVYQGLAAGRAVVTGEGQGIREVFTPGVHLEMVPRGNAAALAETLARTIADAGKRACLGHAGRERVRAIGTPDAVGEQARRALEGGGERIPT